MIVLDDPSVLPEGTEVTVVPVPELDENRDDPENPLLKMLDLARPAAVPICQPTSAILSMAIRRSKMSGDMCKLSCGRMRGFIHDLSRAASRTG